MNGAPKHDCPPLTTDPNHPCLHETLPSGQQETYLVLSEEERAKGFVRPVRRSYVHVGPPPQCGKPHAERADRWCASEAGHAGICGPVWNTMDPAFERPGGCGTRTTMGLALAETYARDPSFYGATFCCGCGKHLPVGARGEFVWDGTTERVGT